MVSIFSIRSVLTLCLSGFLEGGRDIICAAITRLVHLVPRLTITRPTAHVGHHIILLWNAHAPVHADEKSHQLWSDFESIFIGAFQSLRDDIEFTLRDVMTLICDNCDL